MAERRIQEILDANTDRIPESLYIQLSNEVMRIYNRPSTNLVTRSIIEELRAEVYVLDISLQQAESQVRTLRRQLDESRSGGELARVKEELEVRKKVNADTVSMYKGQITSQCAKIVEYKAKIRELTEKLESRTVYTPAITTVIQPMNPWVAHVREWVKTHNITYAVALKDQRCKEAYWMLKRQNAVNQP